MNATDISHTEEIFTVSRLNRDVRFLIEGSFPAIWIEGEVSNFIAAQSGHWYFSLKDEAAQVRCAMFKPQNRRLAFTPKDGMHIMMKAKVSLYEGRGDFQLLAEHMEEAGLGKLQKAFEALKKRLAAAGLFDSAHKKALPSIPMKIGIITSSTGAAIRDILHVIKRRFSCASIIIYPTLVQGELAANNIVAAIETANQRNECDALILARGGGSIEDLWPFNEEIVAHAIYNSQLPMITGIGHEIDFTIADFVADVRAPTPSAAAELLTPDKDTLLSTLESNGKWLQGKMQQTIKQSQQELNWLFAQLQHHHPKRRLHEKAQQLDHQAIQLMRLILDKVNQQQQRLNTLSHELVNLTPEHTINTLSQHLSLNEHRLQNTMQQTLQRLQLAFVNLTTKLDTLSPLATLKRGYAIAMKADGMVLQSAKNTAVGETIEVKLMEGKLRCSVLSKN